MSALWAAIISIDRICEQIAAVMHSYEPQIYSSIIVILLFGFFPLPPKDDSDQF
jgi:hypothetical protein